MYIIFNFNIDVKAQMLSFQQNSLVQAQHIFQAELPFTVGKPIIVTSILLYTTIMKNCVLRITRSFYMFDQVSLNRSLARKSV